MCIPLYTMFEHVAVCLKIEIKIVIIWKGIIVAAFEFSDNILFQNNRYIWTIMLFDIIVFNATLSLNVLVEDAHTVSSTPYF